MKKVVVPANVAPATKIDLVGRAPLPIESIPEQIPAMRPMITAIANQIARFDALSSMRS